MTQIGYNCKSKAKELKKSVVPGIWTILMHFILRGLFRNHGGTNTMSKDWIYVVYIIFTGKANIIDLPKVLWKDFWKFAVKRKLNEIPSPILWALILQKLYPKRNEAIKLNSNVQEVYYSFKTIKAHFYFGITSSLES